MATWPNLNAELALHYDESGPFQLQFHFAAGNGQPTLLAVFWERGGKLRTGHGGRLGGGGRALIAKDRRKNPKVVISALYALGGLEDMLPPNIYNTVRWLIKGSKTGEPNLL